MRSKCLNVQSNRTENRQTNTKPKQIVTRLTAVVFVSIKRQSTLGENDNSKWVREWVSECMLVFLPLCALNLWYDMSSWAAAFAVLIYTTTARIRSTNPKEFLWELFGVCSLFSFVGFAITRLSLHWKHFLNSILVADVLLLLLLNLLLMHRRCAPMTKL